MSFSDLQARRLRGKLDRSRVKSRDQAGRDVSYVEGWYVMAEANRIFGFEGWDRITLPHQLLFERQEGGRTRCACRRASRRSSTTPLWRTRPKARRA